MSKLCAICNESKEDHWIAKNHDWRLAPESDGDLRLVCIKALEWAGEYGYRAPEEAWLIFEAVKRLAPDVYAEAQEPYEETPVEREERLAIKFKESRNL